MSATPARPPTHVAVFVQLMFGDAKKGSVTEVTHVDRGERVSTCLRNVFDTLSIELVGVGLSQVKLFLSDEAGVEATPALPIGDALKPHKILRDEVRDRLLSARGEDSPEPNLLFLLAVVENSGTYMVPTGADAVQALSATLRDMRMELKALTAAASKTPSLSSIITAANVGQNAIEALRFPLPSRITVFEPTTGDAAVSTELLATLRECATEEALVSALLPTLCSVRGLDAAAAPSSDLCPLVMVNSERSRWLDSLYGDPLPEHQRKKPDLFVTWSPCWTERSWGGAAHAEDVVRCGVLSSRELQKDGCVCEFYEAKFGVGDLTATDFGQLVDYHTRVPSSCRGMLFNAREFWLYESYGGLPQRLIQAEWAAAGSKALIRTFFKVPPLPLPPLIALLRPLMRTLGVQPCASPSGDGSFLGAGGLGRAFAVRYSSSQSASAASAALALKVSCIASQGDLEREFGLLVAAKAVGAPVAAVVSDSLKFVYDTESGRCIGGGYLMQDVGARVSVTYPARCVAVFSCLRELHDKQFAHGDARLPNLLARPTVHPQCYFWIDMRSSCSGASHAAMRADARLLAASILHVKEDDLPPAVMHALSAVPGDSDAYRVLATAVFDAK